MVGVSPATASLEFHTVYWSHFRRNRRPVAVTPANRYSNSYQFSGVAFAANFSRTFSTFGAACIEQ